MEKTITRRTRLAARLAAVVVGAVVMTALAGCAAQAPPVPTPTSSPVESTTPTPLPTPTPTPASTGIAMPFTSLVVGDCLSSPAGSEAAEVGTVTVVSCALSHTAEVYALPSLSGGSYPGDEAASDSASDVCGDAFTAYIGVGYETSDLDYSFYPPDQNGWNSGLRQVTCVVFYPQGNTVGSVKGIGTTPPQLAG